MKIIQFSTDNKMLFAKVRKIRFLVFIKEQKVEESEEFDEFENDCSHYIIYFDSVPVGTARWRFIGNKIKLERFAILKEYRGKNIGNALLKKVLEDVLSKNKLIYLHAQLKAIPFYEREGFEKIGDLFVECDIEHFKMEWKSKGEI